MLGACNITSFSNFEARGLIGAFANRPDIEEAVLRAASAAVDLNADGLIITSLGIAGFPFQCPADQQAFTGEAPRAWSSKVLRNVP